MPSQDAKQKLQLLAEVIKRRQLTVLEINAVASAFDRTSGPIKNRVVDALSEGLGESRPDVTTKLASSNDSDRIIDDIVDILKK